MSDRTDNDAARKAVRQIRREAAEKSGAAAWADYRAKQDALTDKTARLKELRLAKQAELQTVPPKAPKRKAAPRKAAAWTR